MSFSRCEIRIVLRVSHWAWRSYRLRIIITQRTSHYFSGFSVSPYAYDGREIKWAIWRMARFCVSATAPPQILLRTVPRVRIIIVKIVRKRFPASISKNTKLSSTDLLQGGASSSGMGVLYCLSGEYMIGRWRSVLLMGVFTAAPN